MVAFIVLHNKANGREETMAIEKIIRISDYKAGESVVSVVYFDGGDYMTVSETVAEIRTKLERAGSLIVS